MIHVCESVFPVHTNSFSIIGLDVSYPSHIHRRWVADCRLLIGIAKGLVLYIPVQLIVYTVNIPILHKHSLSGHGCTLATSANCLIQYTHEEVGEMS